MAQQKESTRAKAAKKPSTSRKRTTTTTTKKKTAPQKSTKIRKEVRGLFIMLIALVALLGIFGISSGMFIDILSGFFIYGFGLGGIVPCIYVGYVGWRILYADEGFRITKRGVLLTVFFLFLIALIPLIRVPQGAELQTTMLADQGGVMGGFIASMLRSMLGDIGAMLVDIVVLLGLGLLITQVSLRTGLHRTKEKAEVGIEAAKAVAEEAAQNVKVRYEDWREEQRERKRVYDQEKDNSFAQRIIAEEEKQTAAQVAQPQTNAQAEQGHAGAYVQGPQGHGAHGQTVHPTQQAYANAHTQPTQVDVRMQQPHSSVRREPVQVDARTQEAHGAAYAPHVTSAGAYEGETHFREITYMDDKPFPDTYVDESAAVSQMADDTVYDVDDVETGFIPSRRTDYDTVENTGDSAYSGTVPTVDGEVTPVEESGQGAVESHNEAGHGVAPNDTAMAVPSFLEPSMAQELQHEGNGAVNAAQAGASGMTAPAVGQMTAGAAVAGNGAAAGTMAAAGVAGTVAGAAGAAEGTSAGTGILIPSLEGTEEDTAAVAVTTDGAPKPRILEAPYSYPPLSMLAHGTMKAISPEEISRNSMKLEEALQSFKVIAKVVNATQGPTVTRYELEPEPGTKVASILKLSDDLKRSLSAVDVRIEAPIPGKSTVGIEVPNDEPSSVNLRDVLESDDFQHARGGIPVGLGKDIAGKPVITDLSKMPHLLIAGSTGSGKSVCVNTLISSILFSRKPSEVKLILVDPKIVELSVYDGVPHLMAPVVTDMKKAASVLRWLTREMDNRYKMLSLTGHRKISSYNEAFPDKALPYILIIIDEMADLMMTEPEVEEDISRLAAKARAAGIHLVLATQRPSVDVITGVIKSNVPSRISFAVAQANDSRIILDTGGAENLLGKGDMLFSPIGSSKPIRIQGAFISDDEVEHLVQYVKKQGTAQYDERVIAAGDEADEEPAGVPAEDRDELLERAIDLVFEHKQASASYIQRRLRVGFSRGARLIDTMEEMKIIGPVNGSKPREILMTREEVYDKYGI